MHKRSGLVYRGYKADQTAQIAKPSVPLYTVPK